MLHIILVCFFELLMRYLERISKNAYHKRYFLKSQVENLAETTYMNNHSLSISSSPMERNLSPHQNVSTTGNSLSSNNSSKIQNYVPHYNNSTPASSARTQLKESAENSTFAFSNQSQSSPHTKTMAQSGLHHSGLPSGLHNRGTLPQPVLQNSYSPQSSPKNNKEKISPAYNSHVQPNVMYNNAPANMSSLGSQQAHQLKDNIQTSQTMSTKSSGTAQNVLTGPSQPSASKFTNDIIPVNQKSMVMPDATQLQSQITALRRRGSEETPVTTNSSISRQGSRDFAASGRETPSFRSLQERYGTPTSPTEFVLIAGKTPLSDIDYQKSARHTVIGELSRQVIYFIIKAFDMAPDQTVSINIHNKQYFLTLKGM
jgi:hypothetical protein